MIKKKHLMFYTDEKCTVPTEDFGFGRLKGGDKKTRVFYVRNESYGDLEDITVKLNPSLKPDVHYKLLSSKKIKRLALNDVFQVVLEVAVAEGLPAGKYPAQVSFKFWLTKE